MGESLTKIIMAAVGGAGGPVAAALSGGAAILDAYNGTYQNLQEGKSNLRLRAAENNWTKEQKHQANVAYKEVCPPLHRSDSPDVFPGY